MAYGALQRENRVRFRSTRLSLILASAVMATLVVAPNAAGDPLPPPNPSDAEIQQSQYAATVASAEVGRLSGVITATQATIQQLHNAMELKAELANKALVDMQLADMNAKDAAAAADEARKAAHDAGGAITEAEQHAANFAAASFRQGSTLGGITALLDADSLDELITRQNMIHQVSGNQATVLEQLNTARTTRANLESTAKAAAIEADKAAQAAVAAKDEADAAWDAAQDAFADGQAQLESLQNQLAEQLDTYQSALNSVAVLEGQRAQYNEWVRAKQIEDARLARQAAVQKSEADDLARERRAAEQLANQEASNRAIALKNEKARQTKLRKERERQEELRKQREAAGLDPDDPSFDVPSNGTRGELVVQAAKKYLGITYAWGGGNANGPTKGIRDYGVADRHGDYQKVGFDCSGLALYAWAQQGVYLPHYSGYQYNYGTRISRNNLQPGDLVFYAYDTSRPSTIHHVAIYMGDGKMIEAPYSGSVVKISPMRWSGYIGATRPGV